MPFLTGAAKARCAALPSPESPASPRNHHLSDLQQAAVLRRSPETVPAWAADSVGLNTPLTPTPSCGCESETAHRPAVFPQCGLGSPRAPFPHAAGSKYPLLLTRTDDHRIDLRAMVHYHKVYGHGRPSVGEHDSEGSGAIGVHRVRATGRRMTEVGDDHTVDGYRVDLSEPTVAIKFGHRHAHLGADGAWSDQFGAFDGKSVVASLQPIVAVAPAYANPEVPKVSRTNAAALANTFLFMTSP
jgi:hypothetical protein